MFGDLPLNELSKKIIREKMSTYQVVNKTLMNVQSCFRSALNDAVEDEILESNPLSGWAY
jgi:integrase